MFHLNHLLYIDTYRNCSFCWLSALTLYSLFVFIFCKQNNIIKIFATITNIVFPAVDRTFAAFARYKIMGVFWFNNIFAYLTLKSISLDFSVIHLLTSNLRCSVCFKYTSHGSFRVLGLEFPEGLNDLGSGINIHWILYFVNVRTDLPHGKQFSKQKYYFCGENTLFPPINFAAKRQNYTYKS